MARNSLKKENVRGDLPLDFSEELGRAFEDIAFRLSRLRFVIDP